MPSKVQDAAGSESSPKPPVTAESGAKSEAVQVAVRVRPLSANEASQGSETCLDVVNGSILLAEKQFDFDVTFPATSDQESVYTTLVAPMVDQFFAGYNATVLAYGQTGTGKTYTMGNEFASSVVPVERGVILRVVQDVFERVKASANPQHFVIRLSYLEILNEEIHDLLNVAKPEPNPPPKSTGLSQTQSASSRPGRLTPQGFSAANGIVESTSGVSALEAENRKLKAELSLANNEKKKWKQIANELTDKNKNESEFAPSKATGSHLDVSAPNKKHANERIMSQQEAHSKVQALGKRLKEALKEMQTLREQSTKKKAAKKRKARESYETMDTLFSSSGEEEDNTEADSDYVDEEVNRNEGNKRKRRCRTPVSEGSKRVDAMDEIDELLETSAATCCACYGKCATKACACKSQNRICNNECSCNSNKCQNRGGDDNTGESSGVVHDSDEVLGMTVSDIARSTPKRGAGDFASETSSRRL
ncbi:hypothetical protein PRNP1_007022 [Phytophthora ramorum]